MIWFNGNKKMIAQVRNSMRSSSLILHTNHRKIKAGIRLTLKYGRYQQQVIIDEGQDIDRSFNTMVSAMMVDLGILTKSTDERYSLQRMMTDTGHVVRFSHYKGNTSIVTIHEVIRRT